MKMRFTQRSRSNEVYTDSAAMEAATIHAWKQTCLDADRTKTVCAATYLMRASETGFV